MLFKKIAKLDFRVVGLNVKAEDVLHAVASSCVNECPGSTSRLDPGPTCAIWKLVEYSLND